MWDQDWDMQQPRGNETNHPEFARVCKSQTCVGNHEHIHIEGSGTRNSALYPTGMCRSVVNCWRRQQEKSSTASFHTAQSLFAVLNSDDLEDASDALVCQPCDALPQKVAFHFGGISCPSNNGESCKFPLPVAGASRHAQPDNCLTLQEEAMAQEQPDTLKAEEEITAWLMKLRRAAGHCSNRNLARLLKDAGKPQWLVQRAMQLALPACESMKPGGQMVPRTATYQIPAAWQCVGCDVGEVMANNFARSFNARCKHL